MITKERVIALTSFGAYYKTNSSSVGYILTAVIEQMTFMGPDETNLWNLSKSTLDTRREAGKALLKLCKSMSTHMLVSNLMELFWSRTGTLRKAHVRHLQHVLQQPTPYARTDNGIQSPRGVE